MYFVVGAVTSVPETTFNNMHGKITDLDTVDAVLGRQPVTRCRVCYKACAPELLGIHHACIKYTIECNHTPEPWGEQGCGFYGDLPPPLMVNVPEGPPEQRASRQGLNLTAELLLPRRCPTCGLRGRCGCCDLPESRPGSTKVSRKRESAAKA